MDIIFYICIGVAVFCVIAAIRVSSKAQKEEALLETMIPDEAWVTRLYPISRKAKLLNLVIQISFQTNI